MVVLEAPMFYSLVVVAAVIIVAVLGWSLWKHLADDQMERLKSLRRGSSRVVSTGELVDGSRHVPVAMALSDSTLFYENPDMSASLDLVSIDEVEYGNELLTGQNVPAGKVMRLRCFSTVVEFVIDSASAPQWQAALPAMRIAR
jgi:hypothetical protein